MLSIGGAWSQVGGAHSKPVAIMRLGVGRSRRSLCEIYTYRGTRTRALVFRPTVCTEDLILCRRWGLPESRFERLKKDCQKYGAQMNASLSADWIGQLREHNFGTDIDLQILQRAEGGIGGASNVRDRQVRFDTNFARQGVRPKYLDSAIMLNLLPSYDGASCWSCEDEDVLWDTFKCVLDARLPPPVPNDLLMIQPWKNDFAVTGATMPYQKRALRQFGGRYNRSVGAFLLKRNHREALSTHLRSMGVPLSVREYSTLAYLMPSDGTFAGPAPSSSSCRQLSSLVGQQSKSAEPEQPRIGGQEISAPEPTFELRDSAVPEIAQKVRLVQNSGHRLERGCGIPGPVRLAVRRLGQARLLPCRCDGGGAEGQRNRGSTGDTAHRRGGCFLEVTIGRAMCCWKQ
eukprot:COSAG01_NODE_3035_length_6690_cov_15.742073_3_plen_402_part_00